MTKYLVKTGWQQPDPRVNAIPMFEVHAKPPEAKRFGHLYNNGVPEVYPTEGIAQARLKVLKANQMAMQAQAEFEAMLAPSALASVNSVPPDQADID